MKLDQIPENDSTQLVKSKKTERSDKTSSFIDNNSTILELLNPLKSINLSSNLHSFYNFKELTKQVEVLMRTQSNIIFYILHQNFMCDSAHKEFFKNMVGRFYDMPVWSWEYYQGKFWIVSSINGLVLTENAHYCKKYKKETNPFRHFVFSTSYLEKGDVVEIAKFNRFALEELSGYKTDLNYSVYYAPFNKLNIPDTDISETREWPDIAFDNDFEFGRFKTNNYKVKRKSETLEENYWFIASFNWIKEIDDERVDFCEALKSYSVYASLGIDNFDKIIDIFKQRAVELDLDWDNDDDWIRKFDEDEIKLIRSLSQTFAWTKEYIFQNEDILDLDVLGLNMTVPWDMELVKFFIDRGFGGRMSENKTVFDKVFEPILTDGIIEKLFNCEYKPYE